MTIQEILEAHERWEYTDVEGEFLNRTLKCEGCEWTAENVGDGNKEVHRAHVAEVLDKHMHEQALQAQVNVLKGVASSWEEMGGQGPTHIYARMLRETAQRINKEAHDA